MKDFSAILKRNFLSPIVITIGILSIILLFLGEFRDAWFISSVVLVNTTLAIIQEIRARAKLRKLELMNRPHARRIRRDGSVEDIMFDQLKVGDQVKLEIGEEVPADGLVVSSAGLEVNESILTGESKPIKKAKSAKLLAVSSVVAGSGIMLVKAVGDQTVSDKMSSSLKRYEPETTPIQKAIARAITFLTFGALGLAFLILIVYIINGQDAVTIFRTIAAGAITVVPEGLLFASTIFLAYGSIRLAQAKVLPQKLSAIEAMALLEVLCLDKTGTLTSEDIKFNGLESFDKTKTLPVKDLVSIIAKETSGGSKTGVAIAKALAIDSDYQIIENLAFSSDRKFSGARVKIGRKIHSVVMGAPEYLIKYTQLDDYQTRRLKDLTSNGNRVLLTVSFNDSDKPLTDLKGQVAEPIGLAVLTNELREGVKKTISYLQRNKVEIKVISGDNLETVRYIAKQAGIKNADKVVDGDELSKLSDDDWSDKVLSTTVFARILPEQKERIVDTLRQSGRFSGMVGDGVNDALAIKKSDFGVAMQAGSAATRRVADIVLLNNSFNSLPIGMKLGNRIMQAIELIASLFFHKIIYMVVLLLSTLALGISYPFEPRHITFMNMFLVSMPTMMWTLFTPLPSQRLSPKYFWRDTLLAVMPIAALTGLIVTISYTFLGIIHPDDSSGVSTTTVIIATFFGIYLVFLVSKMFNIKNNRSAKLARLLYILAVIFVLSISFGFGFTRDFFDFTAPAWRNSLPLLVLIICIAIFQWKIAKMAGERVRSRIKNN